VHRALLLAFALLVFLSVAGASPQSSAAAPSLQGEARWRELGKVTTMPLYRPLYTAGLRFAHATRTDTDPGCAFDGREMVRAYYTKGFRTLEMLQGHPRYCTDRPLKAPKGGTVRVGGATLTLYDICDARGCKPGSNRRAYALEWCKRGTTVTLIGVELTRTEFVRIARSLRAVDDAPPLPCPVVDD
jgi:hypothetical protein